MNEDLDTLLSKLANAPTPPTLAGLSDRVMARVHADATLARHGTMVGIAAAIGALLLGAVGPAAFPAAASPKPLAPLGASAVLAPSTLLGGGQ